MAGNKTPCGKWGLPPSGPVHFLHAGRRFLAQKQSRYFWFVAPLNSPPQRWPNQNLTRKKLHKATWCFTLSFLFHPIAGSPSDIRCDYYIFLLYIPLLVITNKAIELLCHLYLNVLQNKELHIFYALFAGFPPLCVQPDNDDRYYTRWYEHVMDMNSPVREESGEWGRGKPDDWPLPIRLFLLLVRQLQEPQRLILRKKYIRNHFKSWIKV